MNTVSIFFGSRYDKTFLNSERLAKFTQCSAKLSPG